MGIAKTRIVSLVASATLAASLIPAPALATMMQDQMEAETPVEALSPKASYRVQRDGMWLDVASLDEAAERETEFVWAEAPKVLELQVTNLSASIEARTRAAGEVWPEEWPSSQEGASVLAVQGEQQTDVEPQVEPMAQEDADADLQKLDEAPKDDELAKDVTAQPDAITTDSGIPAGAETLVFEELQVRLTGEDAQTHDVWYRVHAGNRGWLGWARNGESAGTQGLETTIDGLQLLIADKDAALPQDMPAAFVKADDMVEMYVDAQVAVKKDAAKTVEQTNVPVKTDATNTPVASKTETEADATKSDAKKEDAAKANAATEDLQLEAQAVPTITYRTHVQTYGWQDPVTDGTTAGTTGESKRMEALEVSLPQGTDGGVVYQAHVQTFGWQDEVSNGDVAGTTGLSKRVEAFKMYLTGAIAEQYDIYYHVHIQKFGWLAWAKNGEETGSTGLALRMEAIEIRLVAKGGTAPSSDGCFRLTSISKPSVSYQSHVQTYGWLDWVSDGGTSGTTGESKRMEALETAVDSSLTGGVELNAHVQTYGWQDSWGSSCGTTGESKRMEAIQAVLTGELEEYFDIYYRVHAQRVGWMDWAKNGESAGTSAMSLRLEAVEMCLVLKGAGAPGDTGNAFIDGDTVGKLGYQNPEGFYQVSSKDVSITEAASAPWDYVTPSRIGVWASRDECVDAFIGRAQEYLGTPYVWDYSCAPGVGVDCIGLVYQCAYACGMDLGGGTGYDDFNPWAHWVTGSSGWHSHDANNFWDYGSVMHVSLDDRQRGDLISWAGHVAIYLGDDQIIEAYPGEVMYNSLWAHGTPRGAMRLFH